MPLALLAIAALLSACVGSAAGTSPDAEAGLDAGADAARDPDAGAPDGSAPATDGGERFAADTFLPWAGGPAYYARWSRGPSTSPDFFPIAVWLQSPSRAADYEAIGVNTFVGLWDGPTAEAMDAFEGAGLATFASQEAEWQSLLARAPLKAWTHVDEPDNAQALPGGGWGACIPPSEIASAYQRMTAADPTRPVYLNLGRSVADPSWPGRGSACSGRDDHYPDYAAAADIASFDIYPVNQGAPLWYVGRGVDRLRGFASDAKPVWTWIETTRYDSANGQPTPAQVKSEVWLALVHGAAGIGYFCHVFTPSLVEAGLLSDAAMKAAVAQIDARIESLAPALNARSVANGVTVSSSSPEVPVDVMLKRWGGATWLFAVGGREGATTATFRLRDFPGEVRGEVLDEGRDVVALDGAFQDHFDSYQVHLYRFVP